MVEVIISWGLLDDDTAKALGHVLTDLLRWCHKVEDAGDWKIVLSCDDSVKDIVKDIVKWDSREFEYDLVIYTND